MGELGSQLIAVATAFGWTFIMAFALFKVLQMTVGLRVTPEEELEGLDITEHGAFVCPDFVITPGPSKVHYGIWMVFVFPVEENYHIRTGE